MESLTSSPQTSTSDDDDLARTLIIELLTHQFCLPVQWIRTQDLILGAKSTERVVEIGPGKTLVNMARRTIQSRHIIRETADDVSRQLLSINYDLDRISYSGASANESIPKSAVISVQATAPTPGPFAPIQDTGPREATTVVSGAIAAGNSLIEDSPVAVADIVPAIISAHLKKPLEAPDLTQTIKALSMGRSTLQNEIVGDLSVEFENLPDNAEEVALDTLCSVLQSNFRETLGTKSTLLIDRMSSQKLPGLFPVSAARDYLQRRWKLGSGRQDAVLLRAVQTQPQGRMKEDEAKRFFDGLAQSYTAQHGLVLPQTSGNSDPNDRPAVADAEALEKLESKQRAGWEEQIALYTSLLGLNAYSSHAIISDLQQHIANLQGKVDEWTAEHGEDYSSGLQPMFSPRKARTYDSWWNWAMQDLLALITTAHEEDSIHRKEQRCRLIRAIRNRSHPRLVSAMRCFVNMERDSELRSLLQDLLLECENEMERTSRAPPLGPTYAPQTVIESTGKISYKEIERAPKDTDRSYHFLGLARKGPEGWRHVDGLSSHLWRVMSDVEDSGLSLAQKTVLITGAGMGSIGSILVSRMLSAGAYVIVTTSSYSRETARYFQTMYAEYGGKGSKLILVPFNQASLRDVEALVKYIYDEEDGLGMDLDYLVPFAAISENGRDISNIDSRSLLAHRLMLTNTLRLMGRIHDEKKGRGVLTRPSQVLLPLSPNHGGMGNDGLYAESKLGLESLFEKFHSEDWADCLLICGVAIGWTRGTKLTADNDLVAKGMEDLGIQTFSQDEMAFYISALMATDITQLCVDEPLIADFTGGMNAFPDIKGATTRIRKGLQLQSEELRLQFEETASPDGSPELGMQIDPKFEFPPLPDWGTEVEPLAAELQGMVDPSRVVVVAGFAELGPWGNARVRWDMEMNDSLTSESWIELASSMGLIQAHSGIVDGQPFSGWLDRGTGKPIADTAIRDKYQSYILSHAGIRLMKQKEGSSPWNQREALHEIEITKNTEPFEVSRAVALELKQAHGENIQLIPTEDEARVKAILTQGARIMLPKLSATPHTVGGQIPTGWNAATHGVPEDIARQADPATLYGLVTAAEALRDAGILDPYELYDHIHVGDVANCVGSGLGGIARLRDVFKGRYQDGAIPKDVLAESFISSCSAWINMLLLSAAGPNKTPVGACATALESLDTACELLQAGKAKICVVGALEDMLKDVSDEFANLHATVDVQAEVASGREPREMSRPTTSTRAGFVEAEGAGIQVVTTASVALEMGLPIHAVIALTHTAMDKVGRSIPAPGRGLLGVARQRNSHFDSPLMSMAYRRRTLQARLRQVDEMRDLQISHLDDTLDAEDSDYASYRKQRLTDILNDGERDKCEARYQYGNRFWTHDDRIAPMRGALAVWGLTIDDIDVVSLHGTSTQANDMNEAALLNQQFQHLGRTRGHVVPIVCQKSLTGHSKGPAGAWMLHGCLQMLRDGRVPGNPNADNIDSGLEQYEYLVFPNKSFKKPSMKAFALQLFGFGQKGAMAVGVHPRYLYAALPRAQFDQYVQARGVRERRAIHAFSEGLFRSNVFEAKQKPPYRADEEASVLMNPSYRRRTL